MASLRFQCLIPLILSPVAEEFLVKFRLRVSG
uniref:Uncharacterized protein n=1 Tax=Arundo donax TaxID=35708 RepID=A0A0A8ZQH8_ARUDO